MRDMISVEGDEAAIFRRNFVANVMDGAFFALGLSFVSLQTVIPVFVRQIGGGNIAIGLVPVLWIFGFNFPQILIARSAQRATHKKALLMKTALGQRIPWLMLAFVAFFAVDRLPTDVTLLLFFTVFFLAAVGGSINLPVWFDLVAKLTPVNRRGRLFAVRSVAAGLLGVLGGAAATYVLNAVSYPASYALLFLLAFTAMMGSFYFLSRLVEQGPAGGSGVDESTPAAVLRPTGGDAEASPHSPEGIPASSALNPPPERALPAVRSILRSQANFRRFLYADALLIAATAAAAFYAVYAIEKFSLPVAYAGTFTAVMMATAVFASLGFGWLADRHGHKLNMLLASLLTGLSCVLTLISANLAMYYLVFVCAAATMNLTMISRLSFIAELCAASERPTYIALANLITSPFILTGIAAGWAANAFGFPILFMSAALLAFASSAVWLVLIEEPRRHTPAST